MISWGFFCLGEVNLVVLFGVGECVCGVGYKYLLKRREKESLESLASILRHAWESNLDGTIVGNLR